MTRRPSDDRLGCRGRGLPLAEKAFGKIWIRSADHHAGPRLAGTRRLEAPKKTALDHSSRKVWNPLASMDGAATKIPAETPVRLRMHSMFSRDNPDGGHRSGDRGVSLNCPAMSRRHLSRAKSPPGAEHRRASPGGRANRNDDRAAGISAAWEGCPSFPQSHAAEPRLRDPPVLSIGSPNSAEASGEHRWIAQSWKP